MTGEFSKHEIKAEVSADGFRSWLMMRKCADGWSSTFWVRITAADGMLRVSGDFEPVIFAYGPSDPVACLQWMAGKSEADAYAQEKAAIGSGGSDRVTRWSVEDARADLREMLAYEEKENPEGSCTQPLRAALECCVDYDGRRGCEELMEAAMEAGGYSALEWVGNIGQRPAHCVGLALRACTRLAALLEESDDGE